jgi:flagellar biosynthesis anti-sigma factor FlgM
MKIRDTPPPAPPPSTGATPAAQKPAAEPADTVATAARQRLEAIVAGAVNDVDAARAARLQALKDQVQAGTYKPDPARTADRMLDHATADARVRELAKD